MNFMSTLSFKALSILSFLISAFTISAQSIKNKSDVKITNPTRLEEYISTHDKSNEPFFRISSSLSETNHTVQLVIDGIENGLLKPLYISPETRQVKQLTYDEWICNIQLQDWGLKPWNATSTYHSNGMEKCVYKGNTYIALKSNKGKQPNLHQGTYWTLATDNLMSHRDFAIIKLDITKGVSTDGKELEQVNYLTFCDDAQYSTKGIMTPRFSIMWSDFINFLAKQHYKKLYYTNAYQLWFGSDVFITHNMYWDNYHNKGPLYFIPSSNTLLEDIDTGTKTTVSEIRKGTNITSDLISLHEIKQRQPNLLVRLNDRRSSKIYRIPLENYVKAIQDSAQVESPQALTLVDAWKMKLFHYDESMKLIYGGDTEAFEKDKIISKNGFFVDSKKADPLCKTSIVPSFTTESNKWFTRFSISVVEEISMNSKDNYPFNLGVKPLHELVYEYLLSGKIKSLKLYDPKSSETISLQSAELKHKYHTTDELKEHMQKEYSYYDENTTYNKGDTVIFKDEYYTALNEPSSHSPTDPTYWKRVKPTLLSWKQLYLFNLHQVRYFNTDGSNTTYKLQYLQWVLPSTENSKGLDLPVAHMSWSALKALLLSDTRAFIEYKGQRLNYADLLDKKEYQSWILKTGFLRADR